MDRYFYTLEEYNGEKFIHLKANLYQRDDGAYILAEWTFFYLTPLKAKKMIESCIFYDSIDGMVDYLDDVQESEANRIHDCYFKGENAVKLSVDDITEETPCGYYFFDRDKSKWYLLDVYDGKVICAKEYENLEDAKKDVGAEVYCFTSDDHVLEYGTQFDVSSDGMTAWAKLNGKYRVWSIVDVTPLSSRL